MLFGSKLIAINRTQNVLQCFCFFSFYLIPCIRGGPIRSIQWLCGVIWISNNIQYFYFSRDALCSGFESYWISYDSHFYVFDSIGKAKKKKKRMINVNSLAKVIIEWINSLLWNFVYGKFVRNNSIPDLCTRYYAKCTGFHWKLAVTSVKVHWHFWISTRINIYT